MVTVTEAGEGVVVVQDANELAGDAEGCVRQDETTARCGSQALSTIRLELRRAPGALVFVHILPSVDIGAERRVTAA